jgi:hypothetical protein
MVVEVLSRFGQALSQHVSESRLAGDGFLVRIRTVSIALLGVVTAIGLGLVVFISQQGWPEVFTSRIPDAPKLGVVQNDAIALAPVAPRLHSTASGRVSPAVQAASPARRDGRRTDADSGVTGSRQVAAVAPAPADQVSAPPPATTAPPAAPSPPQTTTPPATEAPPSGLGDPSQPASSPPGAGAADKDDHVGGYVGSSHGYVPPHSEPTGKGKRGGSRSKAPSGGSSGSGETPTSVPAPPPTPPTSEDPGGEDRQWNGEKGSRRGGWSPH